MASITSVWQRIKFSRLSLPWLQVFLFIGVGAFYVFTLQPSLTWGDGARIQIEAITGGSFVFSGFPDEMFAHDPYPFARVGVAAWDHPLYIYVAHTLVRLLPGVNSLWLVNFISALFGAAAVTVFYQLTYTMTSSVRASLLASLGLAFSHTFWFHASSPEVYTLLAFLLLATIYLFNEYQRTQKLSRLGLAGFTFGLAAANHLLAYFLLAAYAIYYLSPLGKADRPRLSKQVLLASAGGFILGFLPFLIQMARMLRIFSLGELWRPVAGAIFLDNTVTIEPLFYLRGVVIYLFYLVYNFNPLLLLIGAAGLFAGRKHFRPSWGLILALYAVYTLFGVVYQVVDQFAFLMMSHIFFAVGIGFGAALVIKRYPPQRRNFLMAAAALSIALTPLFYAAFPHLAARLGVTDQDLDIPMVGAQSVRSGIDYYFNPNKRGDTSAYQFGLDTFLALPPDAFVVSHWYSDLDEYLVFDYFSAIEGQRPDVQIASWLTDDPFSFDPQLAVDAVDSQIATRPVYLASLSEEFYKASYLVEQYCIFPEHNLYRVVPKGSLEIPLGIGCISVP